MPYAKLNVNGGIEVYPYSTKTLLAEYPECRTNGLNLNLSLPANVVVVLGEVPESYDPSTQYLEYSEIPALVEGKWVLPVTVIDRPVVDNSDQIRASRDSLLSACDWTQVADAPVDQAAWATYRQALRDIPQQAGFPTDITWPTKPE